MEFRMNEATPAEILSLIKSVDFPAIRGATPMDMDYAEKLHRLATTVEAWHSGTLVGIICAYTNDMESRIAHGSLFCVKKKYRGCGAALMRRMLAHCRSIDFKALHAADIDENNVRAYGFYVKLGGKTLVKDGNRLAGQIDL